MVDQAILWASLYLPIIFIFSTMVFVWSIQRKKQIIYEFRKLIILLTRDGYSVTNSIEHELDMIEKLSLFKLAKIQIELVLVVTKLGFTFQIRYNPLPDSTAIIKKFEIEGILNTSPYYKLSIHRIPMINQLFGTNLNNPQQIEQHYNISSSTNTIKRTILENFNAFRLIDLVDEDFAIDIDNGMVYHEIQLSPDAIFTVKKILDGYIFLIVKTDEIIQSELRMMIKRMSHSIKENQGNCVICFKPVGDHNAGIILACCHQIAHSNHMSEWLDRKNSCPYCGQEKPKLYKISAITTKKK